MTVFRIVHRTRITYSSTIRSSYNEARMRPLAMPGQRVLSATLTVRPATFISEFVDYWGTDVDFFEVLAPHDRLVVKADSRVERSEVPLLEPSGWDMVLTAGVADRLSEYLLPTPATVPPPELAATAAMFRAEASPRGAAVGVANAVRDAIEYVPGVTGVHTRATESWAEGRGVCQDIAHLCVGALRAMSVPARYVSGYLQPAAGQEAQSHAWVEYWAGDWYGYDPTSRCDVGLGHIVVARGRDYRDVTPLRGVYGGRAMSSQVVGVSVTAEG